MSLELPTDSASQLVAAVEEGRLKLVKLFLDRDTDVNCKDDKGRTPLMLAVLTTYIDVSGGVDNEKMAQCLLRCGANANRRDAKGKTALMYAVELNRGIGVVRLLLSYGADPTVVDKQGRSPLKLAAAAGPGADPCVLASLVSVCKARGKDVIIINTPAKDPSPVNDRQAGDEIARGIVSTPITGKVATAEDRTQFLVAEHMPLDERILEHGLVVNTANQDRDRGQSGSRLPEMAGVTETHVCLLKNRESGGHQSGGHQSGGHQSGGHQSGGHQSGGHQSGGHQSRSDGKVKMNRRTRSLQSEFDDLNEGSELSLNQTSPRTNSPSPAGSPFSTASVGSPRCKKGSTHSLDGAPAPAPRGATIYNSGKLMKMPPHMRKLIRRNTTDLCQYPSEELTTDTRQSLDCLPQGGEQSQINLTEVRNSLLQWEQQLLNGDSGATELPRTGSLPLLTEKPKAGTRCVSQLARADCSFGSGSKLEDSISMTRPGTLPALNANKGPPLPDIGKAWQ